MSNELDPTLQGAWNTIFAHHYRLEFDRIVRDNEWANRDDETGFDQATSFAADFAAGLADKAVGLIEYSPESEQMAIEKRRREFAKRQEEKNTIPF